MIECVPNFSEGRDLVAMGKIVDRIAAVPGVLLLGWEADSDHNRTVVTFAGEPDAVMAGAIAGVGAAAEFIDLRGHDGVHPRVGAADVVPFIPLASGTLQQCIDTAHQVGQEIWARFGVPAYFYEHAARIPERRPLQNTRRKGFDGRPPDVGNVAAHPSAGASMVGAREILVAYNVNLDSTDVSIAKAIATKIRESSGGLPFVKAMGLYLESLGCAQVSMNLTRYTTTPIPVVYEAIAREAAKHGVSLRNEELIGFAPRAAGYRDESKILESRIAQLLNSK